MISLKKETPLIQVCRRIKELCKRSGIKKYSSKFSNKIFDNYQLITLLTLKQKTGAGYESFIGEELIELPHVVEFLRLETIPHPDTLNKFATRTKQTVLELVLLQTTARTGIKKLFLGQDGTGFKSKKISHYYVFRIEYSQRKKRKKHRRGRPRKKRKRKKYIYVQIMVELRTQMPLGVLISRKPADDYNKFKPVAKKVMKLGKAVKIVILDKGYDAEKVHEFIREVMDALSIIPARNEDVPVHRTKGRYRKQMKRGYSRKKYYQRNKNETVNSVVKRKWGDGTLALDWRNQNKEIIFRLILYAARRFTSIVFLCFSRNIILPLKKWETYGFLYRGFLGSRFCCFICSGYTQKLCIGARFIKDKLNFPMTIRMENPQNSPQKESFQHHEQILQILSNKDEITWQSIIYDLVKSEQMDPWDVDVSLLTKMYIETLKKLKELDMSLSGKVVLASALLLKIKSKRLLKEDIENLDNLLSGRDEDALYEEESAAEPEGQRPSKPDSLSLIPKTPQPRKRKVSVFELVDALRLALDTDRKRINRVRPVEMEVPEKTWDISQAMKNVYNNIVSFFTGGSQGKLTFSHLTPSREKKDMILTFLPLLHLANQRKVDLIQEEPFGEIEVRLNSEKQVDRELGELS